MNPSTSHAKRHAYSLHPNNAGVRSALCPSPKTAREVASRFMRSKEAGLGAYLFNNSWGWPEPYIYTVYDRIFSDFPAKNTVYTPYIYMVLANPTYGKA